MFNQEDLQNERRKQINTLKIFNANVSETRINSEYRVDFVSGQNKFALLVLLSPYFPFDKPVFKIFPSISHHWVDSTGNEIISAPGLLSFSRHSDLGRVVQAVIRELQLRPPLIIGNIATNTSPYNSNYVPSQQQASYVPTSHHSQHPQASYIPTSHHSKQQPHYVPNLHQYQQPQELPQNFESSAHVSSNLPDLSKLSLSELKLLNENEEYLEAFVQSSAHMKELDSLIDSLISTNESLATETLEKEMQLKEKSEELKSKVEILTELQDKHEMKNHQYDQLVEKYSPQSIRENLMKSVKLHECDSDVILENFLDKKINLETFLSSYFEKRVATHRLQTKGERLSYQLEALEKASH